MDPIRVLSPLRPQSWNKNSYVENRPLHLVDPDGREVQVPDILQESVQLGINDGATFRHIFETLNDYPANEVLVPFGPPQTESPPGTDAIQVQTLFEDGSVKVVIRLRVGDTGPARIGHELSHVLELKRAGKSLRARFDEKDPAVTRSAAGYYESRYAKGVEQTIGKELRRSRRERREQRKKNSATNGLDALVGGRSFMDSLQY